MKLSLSKPVMVRDVRWCKHTSGFFLEFKARFDSVIVAGDANPMGGLTQLLTVCEDNLVRDPSQPPLVYVPAIMFMNLLGIIPDHPFFFECKCRQSTPSLLPVFSYSSPTLQPGELSCLLKAPLPRGVPPNAILFLQLVAPLRLRLREFARVIRSVVNFLEESGRSRYTSSCLVLERMSEYTVSSPYLTVRCAVEESLVCHEWPWLKRGFTMLHPLDEDVFPGITALFLPMDVLCFFSLLFCDGYYEAQVKDFPDFMGVATASLDV